LNRYAYTFYGETFSVNSIGLFSLSTIIGVIGGIYGIGGGAIIAPLLVTIFRLPVYTVVGAALLGTFVTSIAGILFYTLLAPFYESHNINPDWMLGGIFGVGGFLGIYYGARFQKYIPAKAIKFIICLIVLLLSFRYIGIF
ncbi:MAG: sulfite exporter TauE/SafE family protein, partial [Desulfobacterota bacterium]|nr:sulfite exporter TauE/SafE family protein [Thermodesulfobacteriota bacterium]